MKGLVCEGLTANTSRFDRQFQFSQFACFYGCHGNNRRYACHHSSRDWLRNLADFNDDLTKELQIMLKVIGTPNNRTYYLFFDPFS